MLARPVRIKSMEGVVSQVCSALKHHWQECGSLQVQLYLCVGWGVEMAGSVSLSAGCPSLIGMSFFCNIA